MVLLYYILVGQGTNLASSPHPPPQKIGKPFDFKTGHSLSKYIWRRCQMLEKENLSEIFS